MPKTRFGAILEAFLRCFAALLQPRRVIGAAASDMASRVVRTPAPAHVTRRVVRTPHMARCVVGPAHVAQRVVGTAAVAAAVTAPSLAVVVVTRCGAGGAG